MQEKLNAQEEENLGAFRRQYARCVGGPRVVINIQC